MSVGLLVFCLRSLYREYGVAFLRRVMLAHPLATLRGMVHFLRQPPARAAAWQGGAGSLVGVGFCLKPLTPACPSGRANHDCAFFESNPQLDEGAWPAPCRDCLIRVIGRQALAGASTLYVMTSAQDILFDVLLPALEARRFSRALLTICRFSFEPIRLALAIAGVEAQLIPFVHGDCREYAIWRRADIGDKPEQTTLEQADVRELQETLSRSALHASPPGRFRKSRHLFEPV